MSGLQKAAGLEEETLQGLKEIFLKFDTDMDGVMTMDQVGTWRRTWCPPTRCSWPSEPPDAS